VTGALAARARNHPVLEVLAPWQQRLRAFAVLVSGR